MRNWRYVPKGAEAVETEHGVVYLYEHPSGVPAAIAYHGKANAHDYHRTYADPARRMGQAIEYLDALRENAEAKAQAKARQKAFKTSLQVGDLLYDSWGYEQTNIDFYEVVTVHGARTVSIRPIASRTVRATGPMSSLVEPVAGRFTGPAERKRVRQGDRISSKYGSIGRYHGKPVHCSWYA